MRIENMRRLTGGCGSLALLAVAGTLVIHTIPGSGRETCIAKWVRWSGNSLYWSYRNREAIGQEVWDNRRK